MIDWSIEGIFKIVDDKNVNIVHRFGTQQEAQQFIDYYKSIYQKPSRAQQEHTGADKVKETEHKIIERYPSAKFPEKVSLYDTVPLEVIIRAVRTLVSSDAQTTIRLSVKPDETEIPVDVILEEGPGFETLGKRYTTISVPIKAADNILLYLNSGLKKRDYKQSKYASTRKCM